MSEIAKIDFGRLDAESDMKLSDYFIDTGALRRIQDGRKSLIIGRKGAGKTALFQVLNRNSLKRDVIRLNFDSYPWELHKKIRESGFSIEGAYVASWQFSFLVSICLHWSKEAAEPMRTQAAQMLNRIYGRPIEGPFEALISKLKRVQKIELPNLGDIGGLGGIEFEPEKAGPILVNAISKWLDLLVEFVEQGIHRLPFTIVIDRLDDGWDSSEESKGILIGILKAARFLNIRLRQHGQPAPVVVMLRSDIYNLLHFNDKNKLSGDTENLVWSPDSLFNVAEARIAKSLHQPASMCKGLIVPPEAAWNKVFTQERMRQQLSVLSYITRRTMHRPRDIVAFCIFCQEQAEKNQHEIVEKTDVYVAERKFSQHIYDELDDEMHKQIPVARELLQTIRDIGGTKFRYQDWKTAYDKRNPQQNASAALAGLQFLFDYSVIGIPRTGGAGGGSTTKFIFDDPLLSPNFTNVDEIYSVHLSLVKHLQLKETKQSGIEETDDDQV